MRHFLSKEERMKMRAEGKAEGEFKERVRNIKQLMHSLNISEQEAFKLLHISEKDIPEVIEHLRLSSSITPPK
jgi:hypothetical protein